MQVGKNQRGVAIFKGLRRTIHNKKYSARNAVLVATEFT